MRFNRYTAVWSLLLVVLTAAALPTAAGGRALTFPLEDADTHNLGRKLLSEGIDSTCLASFCTVPLASCLLNSGCVKALLGVQLCNEDPLLTKLVSSCNPVPINPQRPIVDACVNLAIYSFKDNPALTTLTACAQQNNCLTGVTLADTDCTNAANPQPGPQQSWKMDARTSNTDWSNNFQALAASGKSYTVIHGLNWGWDCFKKQRFTFSYSSTGPTYKAVHTVDLTVNMGPLKFPYLMTLGGAPTVTWPDMAWSYCPPSSATCTQPGVFTMALTTAGVKESDPWLVLDVTSDTSFVLALNANNVAPIDNVYIGTSGIPGGMPGGVIMVQDGFPKDQISARVTQLQGVWGPKHGVDFSTWCKLY